MIFPKTQGFFQKNSRKFLKNSIVRWFSTLLSTEKSHKKKPALTSNLIDFLKICEQRFPNPGFSFRCAKKKLKENFIENSRNLRKNSRIFKKNSRKSEKNSFPVNHNCSITFQTYIKYIRMVTLDNRFISFGQFSI